MARKFLYIPAEEYSRLRSNDEHPHKVAAHQDKQDMYDILYRGDDDKSMPDDVRQIAYNQSLQRYLQHKHFLEQPVKVGIHNVADGDDMGDRQFTGAKPIMALEAARNTFRGDADELAQFLFTRVPGLEWNQRGEVIVDGTLIPLSSLAGLMGDIMRPGPSQNPPGSHQLARILRRARIPPYLVRETTDKYIYTPLEIPERHSMSAPQLQRTRTYSSFLDVPGTSTGGFTDSGSSATPTPPTRARRQGLPRRDLQLAEENRQLYFPIGQQHADQPPSGSTRSHDHFLMHPTPERRRATWENFPLELSPLGQRTGAVAGAAAAIAEDEEEDTNSTFTSASNSPNQPGGGWVRY